MFFSPVCLTAIKMEGEDAQGGFFFFKAIDACAQMDSEAIFKQIQSYYEGRKVAKILDIRSGFFF